MTSEEFALKHLAEAELEEGKLLFKPKNKRDSNYWRGFRDGVFAKAFDTELAKTPAEKLSDSLKKYVEAMDRGHATIERDIAELKGIISEDGHDEA